MISSKRREIEHTKSSYEYPSSHASTRDSIVAEAMTASKLEKISY
jgi:hypothetical protein